MKEYLEGFRSLLPQAQQKRLKELMDTMMSNNVGQAGITDAEFQRMASRLAEDRDPMVRYTPVTGDLDKISSEQFNTFHTQVYNDLLFLFSEADLVDSAIINYEYIHQSEIKNLKDELAKLRSRIDGLKLAAQDRGNVITKTEDFTLSSNIEPILNATTGARSQLYKDRDGSDLEVANINNNGNNNQLTLRVVEPVLDKLRDSEGGSTAKIVLSDFRGAPSAQVTHTVVNAIDGNITTYWGEVVLSDEVINMDLKDANSFNIPSDYDGDLSDYMTVIPAGGAISKVVIDLPTLTEVNEITIEPFGVYPLEVACVRYETNPGGYELPKYIMKPSEAVESSNTMVLQFAKVIAKRLVVYLRQKNYTRNDYVINDQKKNSSELWEKITLEETESTLGSLDEIHPSLRMAAVTSAITETESAAGVNVSQDRLDELSGWNTYMTELEKYKVEVQAYINSVKEYNKTYGQSAGYNLPEWVLKLPGLSL